MANDKLERFFYRHPLAGVLYYGLRFVSLMIFSGWIVHALIVDWLLHLGGGLHP